MASYYPEPGTGVNIRVARDPKAPPSKVREVSERAADKADQRFAEIDRVLATKKKAER